ncbi:hypothetical protein ACVIGB_000671 [Bradyrhizobium sp. USDA 4341]
MAAFISVLSLFGIVIGLFSVVYPPRQLLIDSRRKAMVVLGVSIAIFVVSATVDGSGRRLEQPQQALADSPPPQKSTAQMIDEACSAAGAVPNCKDVLTKQMADEAAHPRKLEPSPVIQRAGECKSDWHQCSDNSDLMNHFADITRGMVTCRYAAEKLAKYGSPTFPFFAFGSFLPGSDYARTGIAVLIEKDAQFQNGYGAMAHTSVTCKYDLNTQHVVDVSIAD